MSRPPIKVDNGSVRDVPDVLVCGECGGRSGEVIWDAYADQDGELIGMVGFANCSRCKCSVCGVLARDPVWHRQLVALAEKALK